MRRLADVLIACVLLAITSALMITVAIAIKWEGPGPVLDRQTCVGRGGRRFQMLKFRTAMHDPRHTAPALARQAHQVCPFLPRTRIDGFPRRIHVCPGELGIIAQY